MPTVSEIPLSMGAQRLRVSLLGVAYRFALVWRDAVDGGWVLDIADDAGTPLVQGIALVTGCDLLGQFPDLGIGGGLRVATDGDPDAAPTFASLGVTSRLYFVAP